MQDSQSFALVKEQSECSWWSYLLWALFYFFIIGGIVSLLALGIWISTFGELGETGMFWANMAGFPIILVSTLVISKKVDNRTLESFGFFSNGRVKKAIQGIGIGFGMFLLVWLLALLLGGIEVSVSSKADYIMIIGIFVAFMVQGTTEEVVCRSYLMSKLRVQFGLWPALLGNSLFFTLLHAGNAGMSFLSILNLIIFGVVFSLLFVWSDNMWLTGLAHGMWNFTQGSIFGVQVSGSGLPSSLFETIPLAGKDLMSGGDFGLEASLIATLLGLVISLFLWKLIQIKYASK